MPMFYFHVRTVDGTIEEDTVGAEFMNADQAVREAEQFARELRREAAESAESVEHTIEVTDARGARVIAISYRATVQTERPFSRGPVNGIPGL